MRYVGMTLAAFQPLRYIWSTYLHVPEGAEARMFAGFNAGREGVLHPLLIFALGVNCCALIVQRRNLPQSRHRRRN